MKATLTNYRQSPRKVRLVADFIRGKNVSAAEAELSFMAKRAAEPFKKLLASAVANAETQSGASKDDLIVKEVRVDKGMVLKRFMPRAFGRASRINKRTSHLVIVLGEKEGAKKAAPAKRATSAKKEDK